MWEDLVGNDSFGELIRVVGKSSKSEGSRLLNTWDIIQKEWSQEGHNTSTLESLDVLWSLG